MVVYFDGACNLCVFAVRFIVRRDQHAQFKFASLQGEYARGRIPAAYSEVDSIILQARDGWSVYSTAALRIAQRLDGLWPLLSVLLIVPAVLRDPIYRWIARNRYRWFGQRDVCILPQEFGIDMRDRILP